MVCTRCGAKASEDVAIIEGLCDSCHADDEERAYVEWLTANEATG